MRYDRISHGPEFKYHRPEDKRRVSISVSLLLAAGLALGSAATSAQEFPAKPVRIIVPFPAGGSFDLTARIIAQRAQLGQNVIIEIEVSRRA